MTTTEVSLDEVLKSRNIAISDVADPQDYKIPDPKESTQRLMEIYYQLKVTADMEIPYWYNRTWWENEGDVPVVRRAKAMAAWMAHTTPNILPYEKLVMGKSKNVRGAFPFPWVCASFFNAQAQALMDEVEAPAESEADAVSVVGAGGGNVTKSFGNVISIAKKFGVRKEEIPVLVKASKPWDGCSIEDVSARYSAYTPHFDQHLKIMDAVVCMFDSWAIPQGREVINYYMPLEYGFDGIIKLCDEKIAQVMGEAGDDGILGMGRGYFYMAMKETTKGLSAWCDNYAKQAKYLASIEKDAAVRANYEEIAEVMAKVAHDKPASFREALQMTLCLHLGVVNEDPQSGQSIGRLGQVLQPYYEKDIADGKLTDEDVIELLELYRIKITCIECFASAGVSGGVLSGNTFNNLSMGGQGYDGLTAVTPLEYLIIEAGMRNKTPQPTLSVLYDEKTPEAFLMKAASCTKLGLGYPAWMNNQTGMNFMLRQYAAEGMDLHDARAWCLGGCLESAPGCFQPLHYNGRTFMIPGGASPTCGTRRALHRPPQGAGAGPHQRPGQAHRQAGPARPQPHHHVLRGSAGPVAEVHHHHHRRGQSGEQHPDGRLAQEQPAGRRLPAEARLLRQGRRHRHDGRPLQRHHQLGILRHRHLHQRPGLHQEERLHGQEVHPGRDGRGDGQQLRLRARLQDRRVLPRPPHPHRGRRQVREDLRRLRQRAQVRQRRSVRGQPAEGIRRLHVRLHRSINSYYGKPMYMCQISVSTHGPQGFVTLATADGRLAGTTYSDGSLSAAAGTDKNGIYAIFESATVYDQSMEQNSQMNLKLHPTAVRGLNGTRKLLDIIRAYMRKGGFHVQFNVVDSKELRKAQKVPDSYRDLMVRVAGFTQYWCEIGKPIQDEVIYRTEYEA